MYTVDPQQAMTNMAIVIAVLAVVLLFVLGRWAMRKILAKDKVVDEWQEEIGWFSNWLSEWQFSDSSDIANSVSAINVSGAIKKFRKLRGKISNREGMLTALKPNFLYQLGIRADMPGEVEEIAHLIAQHPKLVAAIEEQLGVEEVEPAADAATTTN